MDFFTGRVIDIAIQGVLSVAPKLVPASLRAQIRDRLDDINPWNDVKTNHDLVRAVRLSWIAASRRVLKNARAQARTDPSFPDEQRRSAIAFADSARARLVRLRDQLRRRDLPVGPSPIDDCLGLVLEGTPEFIDAAGRRPDETALNERFTEILTELIGARPEDIQPLVYLVSGGRTNPVQDFSALVFAEFAELIKDGRYPQATEAFRIHLWNRVMGAVGEVSAEVREAAAKLPTMEAMLAGASASLSRIEAAQERHGETLESVHAHQAAANRKLDHVLALLLDDGTFSDTDRERLRLEVERSRQTGDIGEQAMEAVLRKVIGGAQPLNDVVAELRATIDGLRGAIAQAQQPHNLQGDFEEQRKRAAELLRNGDLDGADGLFADLDEALTDAHRAGTGGTTRRARAAVKADRAGIAMTRHRYLEAAALYRTAAEIVAEIPAQRARYADQEIQALMRQGEEHDEVASIQAAIKRIAAEAEQISRGREPVRWAENRLNLARVALMGGMHTEDPGLLETAANAFGEAMLEEPAAAAIRAAALVGRAIAYREWSGVATKGGKDLIAKAITEFEKAGEALEAKKETLEWAVFALERATAWFRLAESTRDKQHFRVADGLASEATVALRPWSSLHFGRVMMLKAEIMLAGGGDPIDSICSSAPQLVDGIARFLPLDRMRGDRQRLNKLGGRVAEHFAARPPATQTNSDPPLDKTGHLVWAQAYYKKAADFTDTESRPVPWIELMMKAAEIQIWLLRAVPDELTDEGQRQLAGDAIRHLKAVMDFTKRPGGQKFYAEAKAKLRDAERLRAKLRH
jgi:hypothetical protein